MMKQQKSTTFNRKAIGYGLFAVVCGIAWICSLLETACGSLYKVWHAGSFGSILNLYLQKRTMYNAEVHRVYTESGNMLLPAVIILLAAGICALGVFVAMRRGGTALFLTFAGFSVPVILLQVFLPSAEVKAPGIFFALAAAAWVFIAFEKNRKKAAGFLAFMLLTGLFSGGVLTASGAEDTLAGVREKWAVKAEAFLYGGKESGMTFGNFESDAAAQRSKASESEGENKGPDVLKVTMSNPQPYYLRGYTADIYTKEGWKSAEDSGTMSSETVDIENALFYRLGKMNFDSRTMMADAGQSAGITTEKEDVNVIRVVNTGTSRRYLYLPYEAQSIQAKGTSLLGGGFLPERKKLQQYTVTALPYSIDSYGQILDGLSASNEADQTEYRQAETNYRDYVLRYDSEIPQACRNAIEEIFPDAEKIKNSGEAKTAILETLGGMKYDESVSDSTEKDFVTGFLERQSGYDKHFAAAAVMAFRYYGIPARFAEGYLITDKMAEKAKAGEEITVTAAEAHCWAEYYEDGIGWLPFETTPTYIGLMRSAGSIHMNAWEKPQPEKKAEKPEDKKTNRIVTTESEVNYWVPTILLLFLLILLAVVIRQIYRRLRKSRTATGQKPRRKDVRSADRRKAVLALMYFIRKRERKEEGHHKNKSCIVDDRSRMRKEAEEIYLEARYSMHEISEEKYQKVWEYYRQTKRRRPEKRSRVKRSGIGVKGMLCLLIVFCLLFTGCDAKDEEPYQSALKKAQDYICETVTEPTSNSVGGEWAVLALTRGDYDLPENFLGCYQKNTEKIVHKAGGVLNTATGYKYTEYARIILGWTAAGLDPEDVAGYNLLEKLTNMENVCRQGINGPIWALIAYDCGGYKIPEVPAEAVKKTENKKSEGTAGLKDQDTDFRKTSREALLAYILKHQTPDGGWTLSGEKADVDLTAMALTAMAPYVCGDAQLCGEITETTRKKVKQAADKAIDCLAEKKADDGGFESWGSKNAESCAQVITALSSLRIDVDADARFEGTLNALLAFQQEDGGFAHTADGDTNQMATEQAAYALTAYERMKNGESRLFDMR